MKDEPVTINAQDDLKDQIIALLKKDLKQQDKFTNNAVSEVMRLSKIIAGGGEQQVPGKGQRKANSMKNDKVTTQEVEQLIKSTGLGYAAFCRRYGVGRRTLVRWRSVGAPRLAFTGLRTIVHAYAEGEK